MITNCTFQRLCDSFKGRFFIWKINKILLYVGKKGERKLVAAIDLFCGAGGSSTGATAAGIWIKYAVNHWEVAIRTHKANHPGTRHIQSRLELVDPRQFTDIDMIMASPECTNHSRAKGAKPRDEQSRATAFEVVRFADLIRPRWIVVENVPDFKSWELYPIWLQALKKLGYGIREQILNSADFGIPQTRERFILTAELNNVPGKIEPTVKQWRPAREIINWRADYPLTPVSTKVFSTKRRVEMGISALGKQEPFIIVYYGSGPQFQSLDRPLRTITTRDRFGLVVPTYKGHMMRMLQPDELLAGHGFPNGYKVLGTKKEQVCQIGNAVSPGVMKAAAKRLVA